MTVLYVLADCMLVSLFLLVTVSTPIATDKQAEHTKFFKDK